MNCSNDERWPARIKDCCSMYNNQEEASMKYWAEELLNGKEQAVKSFEIGIVIWKIL